MKRTRKRRKDETLGEWCERIAPLCTGIDAKQMQEVLHSVSVSSYIEGSNARAQLAREHPEWI
jgi:hypothetical protein